VSCKAFPWTPSDPVGLDCGAVPPHSPGSLCPFPRGFSSSSDPHPAPLLLSQFFSCPPRTPNHHPGVGRLA
jgi:hypothetical protein